MFAGRFSSSIGLVGVDFGTRAIKMLQLREHGPALRVVGAGRIDMASVGNVAEDPSALVDQLRGIFASGGFTGRRCVVSLPRHAVCLQSVRLPKMPEPEMRQAAVWEAAQRFGFSRTAMEVDIIRTGAALQGAENREEILLIAASHSAINTWLEPLLTAGLRPVAVETHFTALTRAFSRPGMTESGTGPVRALVDVGRSGSTVLILRGDQIAFCKPITIGGEHFDQAVAEHLQMDAEEARDLRAARIAAATDQPNPRAVSDPAIDRAVYHAVRVLLASFAKEVMLCIGYYGVTFRGQRPDRLILTGGDALEPNLAETLAQHTKIAVAYDDEESPVSPLMAQVRAALHRAPGPACWWSVAAGLSLRGMSSARLRKVQAWRGRREAA